MVLMVRVVHGCLDSRTRSLQGHYTSLQGSLHVRIQAVTPGVTPSQRTRMPFGFVPTATVFVAARVATSTTVTLAASWFVT